MQILVLLANIQVPPLKADEEKGSVIPVMDRWLVVTSKRRGFATYGAWSLPRKRSGLIFLAHT